MTYDEAAKVLVEHAGKVVSAFNRAGEFLLECERRGIRVPHRVAGLNCEGMVTVLWLTTDGRKIEVAVAPGGSMVVWRLWECPHVVATVADGVTKLVELLAEVEVEHGGK